MKKLFLPDVIDQIQNAEKLYYVALQQYATAVGSNKDEQTVENRKHALCDAFAELHAAHGRLSLDCDDAP